MICNHHGLGGAGATDLAEAVVAACEKPSNFKFLYDASLPIKVWKCVAVWGQRMGLCGSAATWEEVHNTSNNFDHHGLVILKESLDVKTLYHAPDPVSSKSCAYSCTPAFALAIGF